jgi:uncharacterized protein YecE (DUF72 family)
VKLCAQRKKIALEAVMEIFIGTSGWSNPTWNPSGLVWYQKHSRLNALELAMPFYHLPTEDQVKEWAHDGHQLLWSIRVNKAVTHLFCFNEIAKEKFLTFRELFLPLDNLVSHYVFQLPPHMHPSNRNIIEDFFRFTNLGSRFALEWHNPKWFTEDNIEWAKKLGLTIASIDSPSLPREIINVGGVVYLRLNGRSDWFLHHYSRRELATIVDNIRKTDCSRVIAFLNNDSCQLKNARALLNIFKKPQKRSTSEQNL